MKTSLRTVVRDRGGIAALEYALIAGLIFAVIIAAGQLFGPQLSQSFTNLASSIDARDAGT